MGRLGGISAACYGVTLEGAARDHDDAMLVPAMQAWVANAVTETECMERFDPYE